MAVTYPNQPRLSTSSRSPDRRADAANHTVFGTGRFDGMNMNHRGFEAMRWRPDRPGKSVSHLFFPEGNAAPPPPPEPVKILRYRP